MLALMEHQGRVPAATATAARTMPLGVVRRRAAATADSELAPYFAEEVRRQLEDRLGERLYDETLTVTTTLDTGLQRAAESELERQLRAVETGALGSFRGPRYSASVPPAAGAAESGTPYLQGAVVSSRGRQRRRPRLGGGPRFPPVALRPREILAPAGG